MIDYQKKYLYYKKKYETTKYFDKIITELKNNQSGGKQYKFKSKKFNNVLEPFYKTFSTYFIRNFEHEKSDDVGDHSIWTALVVVHMLSKEKSKSKVKNEENPSIFDFLNVVNKKYYELLIFSAFIHDIGKTGDGNFIDLLTLKGKPDHHNVGMKMLLGLKKFITYIDEQKAVKKANELKEKNNSDIMSKVIYEPTNFAYINIEEFSTNLFTMLKENKFTTEDIFICTIIVGMSDKLEEYLYSRNYSQYKADYFNVFNQVLNIINKIYDSDFKPSISHKQLLAMCIIVEISSMLGSDVVEGKLGDLPKPTTVYSDEHYLQKTDLSQFDYFLPPISILD